MGLKHQLGRAMMNRVEAMPSVRAAKERSERLGPVEQAASRLAFGAEDDETAAAKLSAHAGASPELLREAAIERSKMREDYHHDRVYRLLSAAAAGGPVQPVPPERAEPFAREAELGRMPMSEAFQRLVAIEPELAGVEHEVRAGDAAQAADGCTLLPQAAKERVRRLVGGGATRDDELLRSTLAGSIADQYLQQLAGAAHLGTPFEAFFDTPRKAFVATVRFGRG